MAREILHGHFSAFYWGQNYGGAEPYVVAAMFALFGQSNFTLGLTPIVLDAIAAVLVWRIGRRLFGSRVGVGAALLFWIWPEVYIFDSTQEYGFRFVTLVCGLAVMLIAIRIAQRREPVRLPRSDSSATVEAPDQSAVVRHLDWLALGLFAGIGWWSSPEVVLLPCAGRRLSRMAASEEANRVPPRLSDALPSSEQSLERFLGFGPTRGAISVLCVTCRPSRIHPI